MNLLQSLFVPRRAAPRNNEEKQELEDYNAAMNQQRGEARSERDRTARIAAYLQCVEEGGKNCRIDISWEELAEQGSSHE
jgi:hypothetical protein